MNVIKKLCIIHLFTLCKGKEKQNKMYFFNKLKKSENFNVLEHDNDYLERQHEIIEESLQKEDEIVFLTEEIETRVKEI